MRKILATVCFWIGHGCSKILELPVPWEWWGSVWYRPYNRFMGWSYRLDPDAWTPVDEAESSGDAGNVD